MDLDVAFSVTCELPVVVSTSAVNGRQSVALCVYIGAGKVCGLENVTLWGGRQVQRQQKGSR